MPMLAMSQTEKARWKIEATSPVQQNHSLQQVKNVWRRPQALRKSSPETQSKQITTGIFLLFCICGMIWVHGECHALNLSEGQQDMFSIFAMTAVPFLSYPSAKPVARFFDALLNQKQRNP